jgi:hypothetical protein
VRATVDYCRKTVRSVCEDYGGDPSAVILTGFSRGAIGCGYLGLHDDAIADIWLAFIPYSHYDGVRTWPYPDSDRAAAIERLQRLKGRASFVCHEGSVHSTREFIESTGIQAPFTFQTIHLRNHNDAWVLRDLPERKAVREWLQEVLRTRAGTHAVRGQVMDKAARPIAGVRIQTGDTHWTFTDSEGRYELRGLIASQRSLVPSKPGFAFEPGERAIAIAGEDIANVDFTGVRDAPPR